MLSVRTTHTHSAVRDRKPWYFSRLDSESQVWRTILSVEKNEECESNLRNPWSRKCRRCGFDRGPLRFRNEVLLIILVTGWLEQSFEGNKSEALKKTFLPENLCGILRGPNYLKSLASVCLCGFKTISTAFDYVSEIVLYSYNPDPLNVLWV